MKIIHVQSQKKEYIRINLNKIVLFNPILTKNSNLHIKYNKMYIHIDIKMFLS